MLNASSYPYQKQVELGQMNDTVMVKSILKFLDLPERKEIMDYVDSHMSRDKPQIARNKKTKKVEIVNNPYALARNSSVTPTCG